MLTTQENQALEDMYAGASFQLVDNHTKKVVGTYTDRKRARRARDKRDNDYGAYRYSVRTTLADGRVI